jgi:hypothetical protein
MQGPYDVAQALTVCMIKDDETALEKYREKNRISLQVVVGHDLIWEIQDPP